VVDIKKVKKQRLIEAGKNNAGQLNSQLSKNWPKHLRSFSVGQQIYIYSKRNEY